MVFVSRLLVLIDICPLHQLSVLEPLVDGISFLSAIPWHSHDHLSSVLVIEYGLSAAPVVTVLAETFIQSPIDSL